MFCFRVLGMKVAYVPLETVLGLELFLTNGTKVLAHCNSPKPHCKEVLIVDCAPIRDAVVSSDSEWHQEMISVFRHTPANRITLHFFIMVGSSPAVYS